MPSDEYAELNQHLADDLALCAVGDRQAFQRVYERTASKFLAIVSDIVQDPDIGRDIVQLGYLAIWRNASKYDASKGRAFTWMLVIMRNRALDHLRGQGRIRQTSEIDENIADDAASPEDAAKNKQLRTILNVELGKLPPRTAQAIRLNVVFGYTCVEISEILDVPANTVKSWIRRGLISLKTGMPFTTVDSAI